jgi:predicted nucleotide-binding protein
VHDSWFPRVSAAGGSYLDAASNFFYKRAIVETQRPALFIGSSSEGLDIARAIRTQLTHDCDVTVWNEGGFPLGETTLESLVNALDRFDFAILVLTPDATVVDRARQTLAPRDNLLFELGLFMGRLGRTRTFAVCKDSSEMKLPSDLAGVTLARFSERLDKNDVAALGPACDKIRQAIRQLGIAPTRTTQRIQTAAKDIENTNVLMVRLVELLAQSRVVELNIIDKQLGGMIDPKFLRDIRINLEELVKATEKSPKSESRGQAQ